MKIRTLLITLTGIFVFTMTFASCSNKAKGKEDDPKNKTEQTEQTNQAAAPATSVISNISDGQTGPKDPTKVHKLTTEEFKQWVFNYDVNQQWAYAGDKPCVIDFYADWCRPCKMVAPIMEELAKEYNGEVYFYKVNVDEEKELAQAFGIRSIPSVLFCPKTGQPQMAVGAMEKENYIKAIEEVMGVKLPK